LRTISTQWALLQTAKFSNAIGESYGKIAETFQNLVLSLFG